MLKPAITAVAMLLGGAAVGVTVYVQTNPYAFTTLEPRLGAGLASVSKELRKVQSVEGKASTMVLDEITVLGVSHRLARAGLAPPPVLTLKPCSNWWELDPQSNVRMLCQ
jgi:hypothetical protein